MKLLKKIKAACIYKSSNIFLSGTHFDNTYYHFFMNALKRNSKLEMTYFPTKDVFDASILKNKFEEFLNNPDDPKWEKIADAGRKYAINNFNNAKACNSLVSLMETMI